MRAAIPVKQILRQMTHSPFFILFGMLLFISGAVLLLRDAVHVYQLHQSTFESVPEDGFVPYAAPLQSEQTPKLAPTLTGLDSAQTQHSVPTPALLPELQPNETQSMPTPEPTIAPERLLIPAIELDAPVVSVAPMEVEFQGEYYLQWVAPDAFAVGWHSSSAPLGKPGNTVLNGHHNIDGEVFRHLVDLEEGDLILLSGSDQTFRYQVSFKTILPERDQPVEVRLQNASWILPSEDERLTLVTCWPYQSNTHRLVIIASPLDTINIEAN